MALSTPSLPSGSGRRQVGTSLSEINVTPLVDVMLVLLVIFMVTAPMMQSGITVNLPQAETTSAPAEEGLTLTITKDRYIHVGESVININLLEQRLAEYFAGKTNKIVYIKADEALPFGYIVGILDAAKKAGIETTAFITEPVNPKIRRK
jgi:biopolymer transport protein TolR